MSILCATSSSVYSESEFVELGRQMESVVDAAADSFATLDVDFDGNDDLVFVGYSGSPMLFVVGKKANGLVDFKMRMVLPSGSIRVRPLAWKPSDSATNHLLTLNFDGLLRDFSGWPLTEQRNFYITGASRGAVVGDVDNDGTDELLVIADQSLHAYSMVDGTPKWNYLIDDLEDIALAQLDADPALEIILGGPVPGIVLDGATLATDWEYIDGFGRYLSTGVMAHGGGVQWVGAAAWNSFTVFRSSPWSPIWSGGRSAEINGVSSARIDASGLDAVVVAEGQWGEVSIYDGTTHAERLHIPNEGYGINDVVAVDFNGDGIDEIAFASQHTFQDGPLVAIASSENGSATWQFTPIPAPYIATALGDVDGDGSVELVAASGHGTTAVITIFDAESGVEEWRSTDAIVDPNDPRNMSVATIALVPQLVGNGMDIVLAGNSYSNGRVCVLDGTTRQVVMQIGSSPVEPMSNRFVRDLALIDYDEDGIEDYAVATEPENTGASGALLQVFSGTDGSTLWNSETMGTGFVIIIGVLVTESPAGKHIVAVLPGELRGYDSSTGAFAWAIPAANEGASFIPFGANGGEIAVFSAVDGQVRFYDAATQLPLRDFQFPGLVSSVTSLGGDLHALLVTTAGTLALVDGETATLRSVTEYLGQFPYFGARISSNERDGESWIIAVGAEPALYRFRIELGDAIFSDSFEQQ